MEATLTMDPRLRDAEPWEVIARTTGVAREMLAMEVAFLSDTSGGLQRYDLVSGDRESFGFGDPIPLEGTYCGALLDGRLDNIVPDASQDPVVCDLEVTERAGIGSYIGVPVILRDGRTYGTFCCVSHAPNPALDDRDVRFMEVLARLVADQLQRAEIEREEQRVALAVSAARALMAALEARDGYTEEHSEAVVELALAVGRELELSEPDLRDIELVALLHDIGKVGIADAVLRKPGALSHEEWEEMRRHPEIGWRIVDAMPPLRHLAAAIRSEHERWDGSGYPAGLRGVEIPVASRIVLVCDAYHAMISDRPYRRSIGHDTAIAELRSNAGSQFCPATVNAALSVLAGAHAHAG
jgi:response regulator RpfG family c-di-GMP phosphodiesterase